MKIDRAAASDKNNTEPVPTPSSIFIRKPKYIYLYGFVV